MQNRRFVNKNVIITGAGRGIGQATAFRFADEGADVMLVGRTPEPLKNTEKRIIGSGGKAWAYQADVTVTKQVQGIVEASMKRWTRIDVLINNAGIDDQTPFLEIKESNWDRVVATDLKAHFLLSQRVAREMVKSGGGVILHNASIDALGGDGPYASYNAAKAGLLGLNRTMAFELARNNIRVNCVSPGYTHTDLTEAAVGKRMMEYLQHSFDRVPMGRLVKSSEVAAAFAFLASDDASAITGTNLVVDCGLTANWYIPETLPDL
jgi:NAD(P)-dependent dehydrogenase (short-subunit alcohol dehydrogenase family)